MKTKPKKPPRPLSADELRQVQGGTRMFDPPVSNAGNAAIDF